MSFMYVLRQTVSIQLPQPNDKWTVESVASRRNEISW